MSKGNEMNETYLAQIKSALDQLLGDCQIYLFGSRATNKFSDASDFDIAVSASRNIDRELSLAREQLENSNIPFTVDLVDLSSTAEEFARRVRQEGIPL
jgi:hypothetical protein